MAKLVDAQSVSDAVAREEPTLSHAKHIKYWRRCLKTYLPYQYTSNDANRMTLAFFILSALDLLGDLDSALSPEERKGHIEWVYNCQCPEGGFRAFPGANLGDSRTEENRIWDPAHVPATFFALLILVLLGDGLERVDRKAILVWLTKMQRPEGSFGEALGENGVEGGTDSRFGYMATGIRWILRGNVEGPVDGVEDVDVDNFVGCVRKAEAYDGGISEAPFQEAHAGFTSCAVCALSFIDRLPLQEQKPDERLRGISNLPLTLHWLASRQTVTLDEDDLFDTHGDETDTTATCHDAHSFVKVQSYPSKQGKASFKDQPTSHFELQWIGVNGRCNKIADTCYAYWVATPLKIFDRLDLLDRKGIRGYLLDRTQHLVGGFGKLVGDPPDLYHSYLGLATISMLGDPSLKNFDPALSMSEDAKARLEALPWRKRIVEGEVEGKLEERRYDTPAEGAELDKYAHLSITGG